MGMIKKSRVLYTVLTNAYEQLNELEIEKEENVDYLCYTDSKNLKSNTWQIELFRPKFGNDPIRSQRYLKIAQTPKIKSYQESLYIDNSVILRKPVNKILNDFLFNSTFTVPLHSFRSTLLDEFKEVSSNKLDDHEKLEEQLQYYEVNYSNILLMKPYWTAIIARKNIISNEILERIWIDHVLRFSRRDQLSFNVALKEAEGKVRGIEIDNYTSEFHEWPKTKNRVEAKRLTNVTDWRIVSESLTQQLEELSSALKDRELELMNIRNSKSWRLTKFLRHLNGFSLKQ